MNLHFGAGKAHSAWASSLQPGRLQGHGAWPETSASLCCRQLPAPADPRTALAVPLCQCHAHPNTSHSTRDGTGKRTG